MTVTRPRPHRATDLLLAAVATITALLVLATASGPAVAAGTDGADGGTPPGKAWVRVGHFVPGMGATRIDLTPLDGGPTQTLAGRATYGKVTDYQTLPPGSWTATVRDSGNPTGEPLLSRSFRVSANDARTIAVLGTSASPRLALLSDDLTPPESGTARVRVLSAAEAADPVTVTAVDGPTIAQDAVLGQATDYATVPAGSWTLQLRAAATQTSLHDVPVTSGSVYTVVVLDAGARSVELDVVTDAAGARTAPQGGAETGLGGTAATPSLASDAAPSLGVLGGLAAAFSVLVVLCSRARRDPSVRS